MSFNGTNGYNPATSLIQATDGNFYGATVYGGTNNYGTVFKLNATNYSLTSLVSFNNTNGYEPAFLLQGQDGNFYGTTSFGGPNNALDMFNLGFGTIFELNASNGSLTTVGAFIGTNGSNPNGLIQATNGTFYGTFKYGPNASNSVTGYGGVYAFGANHAISNLFYFNNTNGANPSTPLAFGTNGLYYGTTLMGGTYFLGSLFDTTTNGNFTNLDSFNGTNTITPNGLIRATDGNLYGTTAGSGPQLGNIYRLKPDGTFTILFNFNGTNGSMPTSLIQGRDGNFYGTTYKGDAYNYGNIFEYTTNGALISLYAFTGTNDASTAATLIQGNDGNFYGTSSYGGAYGKGNIFKLSVIPNPQFQSITQSNSTVYFTWAAAAGHNYEIQYSTNLPSTNWLNLKSVATTNALGSSSDTVSTNKTRFYRIMFLN